MVEFASILFSNDNLVFVGINIIATWGVYVAFMTHQISLAQGGFMAIGAYMAGAATVKWGMPLGMAIPVAILSSGFIGVAFGYPALRTRGLYLVMVTLGLNEVIRVIFQNVPYWGGQLGFQGMRGTTVGLVWTFVLILGIFIIMLEKSRFGKACRAIFEDEIASSTAGINIVYVKVASFGIGAAMGGLSGALYAHYMFYIEPNNFGMMLSIQFLLYLILGGHQTFWGCALGVAILTYLPEYLRWAYQWRMVIYAILALVLVTLRPQGIITIETSVKLKSFINRLVAKLHGTLHNMDGGE
ncbi:MAG: branched-chain amino acid ABC transporter permease [Pseudomonadota bacterium]